MIWLESLEYVFYEAFAGVTIEQVCALLLAKIYESGINTVVYSPLPERVGLINSTLWTFKQNSFIPHGSSETDVQPSLHPIWITTTKENPNNAQVLVSLDSGIEPLEGQATIDGLGFTKTVYVTSSSDIHASKNLRSFYGNVSKSCTAKFWVQQKNGDWQRL